MFRPSRFVPSLESLGERWTPAATDPGYVGDIISQYGWVLPAPGGSDSIWIDISAPPQTADGSTRYFNGIVTRISAGDANEAETAGFAPTILLQRLANPDIPATPSGESTGTRAVSVYTVTFGGTLY
jgi:hypothetical protein